MTYTSPTKKAQIVLLRSQGVSEKEIAEKYSVDRSTVNHIFKKYKETKDFYYTKKKSGHPRKFTAHDVRIATRMLASTKAHDVADLQRQHFPNLHADTIRKRLTKCGLKAYVHRTKPFLSDTHKKRIGLPPGPVLDGWTGAVTRARMPNRQQLDVHPGRDGCGAADLPSWTVLGLLCMAVHGWLFDLCLFVTIMPVTQWRVNHSLCVLTTSHPVSFSYGGIRRMPWIHHFETLFA